jgi:hypothetical protein
MLKKIPKSIELNILNYIGLKPFSNISLADELQAEDEDYILEALEDPRDCSFKIYHRLGTLMAGENNYIYRLTENSGC